MSHKHTDHLLKRKGIKRFLTSLLLKLNLLLFIADKKQFYDRKSYKPQFQKSYNNSKPYNSSGNKRPGLITIAHIIKYQNIARKGVSRYMDILLGLRATRRGSLLLPLHTRELLLILLPNNLLPTSHLNKTNIFSAS